MFRLQLNTTFCGRYLAPPSSRFSGIRQKKGLHIAMRGGSGGGPNRQGGRGRGGGGRGGGRGGGGQQRWWDPQWRAERLKQMREERPPEVMLDENEWMGKLEDLKARTDIEELIVKENIGRDGGDVLKRLAAEVGLYFHAYNKGTNTVCVVSKIPLPNYRADLDKRHGSSQREIQMSADTEQRVENVLSKFRSTNAASSSRQVSSNGSAPISKQLKVADKDDTQALETEKNDLNTQLKNQQQQLQASDSVRAMLMFRDKLPTFKMRDELIQAVARSQVLVVSGETGCGKTTQLPQFILEHEIANGRGADCNIICTQPRRISAISVATRVAAERGDNLGETVGYQIRLESRQSASTRLLFCTTGVLLRKLVQDPTLKGTSHVLVDEIHERGMNEDFLIIILRDLLPQRPDLRLVLMSATINAEMFSRYFSNAPMIHIPGFTFPVTQYFLEDVLERTGYRVNSDDGGGRRGYQDRRNQDKADSLSVLFEETDIEKEYCNFSRMTKQSLQAWNCEKLDIDLVEASIEYICRHEGQGAILVFLTGWDDISKLMDKLKENSLLRDTNKFLILPLHGSMPTINQREIFQRPPDGMRKIVVATNIAETSITIDDVVYVLDCGKAKETSYDALNKLACLLPSWISKASALQRKGRAGRVQPGVCYHLYPKLVFEAMPQYQLPEILRTPLQELCLQIKSLRLGRIAEFLSKALQPPEPLAVQNAIELLMTIGALNDAEELTPLGCHLATLPMDPRIGKMLLMGAIFQCLGPALTIAAALGHRDPFVLPIDRKEAADEARRRFAGESYSDHIAILRAFEGWQMAKHDGRDRQYCWQNYLSSATLNLMEEMRLQFLDLLSDIGFYNRSRGVQLYNRFSSNLDMVRAVLCAGLFPSIAQCKQRGKRTACFTKEDGKVSLHPASVNARVNYFPFPWLIYSEKVKTTDIYIRDSTNITDYAVLLFGGNLIPNKKGDGMEMLGGYLQFSATKKVAHLVQELRRELDGLLQQKIEQPQLDIHDQGKGVVNSVLELLESDTVRRSSREEYASHGGYGR
ncbi:hypothetical protein GOP47_0022999 [Adiantum capillus-veneris]|uniref:RNA helicase n=1 Tax=Adiantum capillus-veneris TaxID=13818 RepID=A0A9D4U7B7_ADICA|nr:hypothetical protein GOP47_0022999 [Adiantum capillus-veneris]